MTWAKKEKKEAMRKSHALDIVAANAIRDKKNEKRRLKLLEHKGSLSSSPSPPASSMSSSCSSTPTPVVRHFPRENDCGGNVEYKLRLVNISPERLEHLRTQMKWRVEEGRGEALYRIGVMDDGEPVGLKPEDLALSLETLQILAGPLGFSTVTSEVTPGTIPHRQCAAVFIRNGGGQQRKCKKANSFPTLVQEEIRVAMLGAFEAGKSSVIGYLLHGVMDDGRGKAGRCVARHKHEIRHGRTSSFSAHCLLPLLEHHNKMKGVENVFSEFELFHHHEHDTVGTTGYQPPKRIVSLLDCGGHPKSLSSSLRGLASSNADYHMICLDWDTAQGRAPDKLAIALGFSRICQDSNSRFFVLVTKMDSIADDDGGDNMSDEVRALLFDGCLLQRVRTLEEDCFDKGRIPVVCVSTVTGRGMDVLAKFLHSLSKPSSSFFEDDDDEEAAASRNGLRMEEEESMSSSSFSATLTEERGAIMGVARAFVLTSDDEPPKTTVSSSLFEEDEDEEQDSATTTTKPKEKLVVVGVVHSGLFQANHTVFVGPNPTTGQFVKAVITSMRCASGSPVTGARAHTSVSMCLRFLDDRIDLKRGAIVCDRVPPPGADLVWTMTVAFKRKNEEQVLKMNEQVVVFIGVANQTCRVVRFSSAGEITLQFAFRQEFVLGVKVMIRRANGTMLVGNVTETSADSV